MPGCWGSAWPCSVPSRGAQADSASLPFTPLQDEALKIFVATVPVLFDSLFKVGCGEHLRGRFRGNGHRPSISRHPARPTSSFGSVLADGAVDVSGCVLCPPGSRSWLQVWIFIGLNKQDPAAAVTLKQMDRH